mgnify:CR=1 FL=1
MTLPPFISQNFGAGNMERVEEAYKKSVRFVMIWQVIIYGVLILISGFGTEFQKGNATEPTLLFLLKITSSS